MRYARFRWAGLAGVLAIVVAVVLGAGAPARAKTGHIRVYFLRGEQLAPVQRSADSPEGAVRALFAGPAPAEARLGFRTYVPAGTRLIGVSVDRGVAIVNVSGRFASGSDAGLLLPRLSQLVRTVTALPGAGKVQLLLDGGTTAGRFPGVPTSQPITFRYLQTPNVPLPEPPGLRLPPPEGGVKTLQQRLIELHYQLPGDDDGRFGPATQNAILAFQKWERLARTGLMDAATIARLQTASVPSPRSRGALGKRAEILLDRQVTLLIVDNQVVRAIAVSSGKPSTPTPPGDYRVYAKYPRWWSVPFREWLPYALPFVGGIAFHEFGEVPAYPASHGCVRQSYTVARWTYAFANVGMPVKVIAKS